MLTRTWHCHELSDEVVFTATGVLELMVKSEEADMSFSEHTIQRGQDCAVDFGVDGVFFGRVT